MGDNIGDFSKPLFEKADPFETLDPKDGFHVVKIEAAGTLAIHCQAYYQGELTNMVDTFHPENATVEIAAWENPTEADQGEATRLHLALDAIARYLTTGGTWRQLEGGIHMMRKVAFGHMVLDGYHLLDSFQTTEGSSQRMLLITTPDGEVHERLIEEGAYQHIFVKDDNSGKAVLWEEPSYSLAGGLVGGFIDRTTLEALREPRDQDDDDDRGEEVEAEAAATVEAEEADAHLLQLPDRRVDQGS